MGEYKYILAYQFEGYNQIEVECLSQDETLIRLNEMFCCDFDNLDDLLEALEYGELSMNLFGQDKCTSFTIASTYNEIIYLFN